MKIIKQGKLPGEELWGGECSNCHTVVEFRRKEGKYSDDQRDGQHCTIPCPLCERTIYGQKK